MKCSTPNMNNDVAKLRILLNVNNLQQSHHFSAVYEIVRILLRYT